MTSLYGLCTRVVLKGCDLIDVDKLIIPETVKWDIVEYHYTNCGRVVGKVHHKCENFVKFAHCTEEVL